MGVAQRICSIALLDLQTGAIIVWTMALISIAAGFLIPRAWTSELPRGIEPQGI